MTIYYDKTNKCFYDSTINTSTVASDTVVEITAEQHSNLLTALNSGCIIFDDLTYSDPKPTDGVYNWDSKTLAWVKDEAATKAALVPESVTSYQAKMAMIDYKITVDDAEVTLLSQVKLKMANLDISTEANQQMEVAYEAAIWRRDDTSLVALATEMGLTSDNLDDLFILAGSK